LPVNHHRGLVITLVVTVVVAVVGVGVLALATNDTDEQITEDDLAAGGFGDARSVGGGWDYQRNVTVDVGGTFVYEFRPIGDGRDAKCIRRSSTGGTTTPVPNGSGITVSIETDASGGCLLSPSSQLFSVGLRVMSGPLEGAQGSFKVYISGSRAPTSSFPYNLTCRGSSPDGLHVPFEIFGAANGQQQLWCRGAVKDPKDPNHQDFLDDGARVKTSRD
jgi:hypothetical protein